MAVRNLQFVLSGVDRSASRTFDKVGDKADKLSGKLAGFAKGAGVGAAVAAGAGVASFGVSSVKAFSESQESATRLQDALDRFPKTADTNAKKLGELNEQLARKTRFDDDATASGQAVLAQFGLTGKQIEDMTPLLQDYAAKTGKDLPSAAEDLGKAVLGQGRALKTIGLDFKDTGTAAGNLEQLQAGLNKQVKGFAEKDGKTAAGTAQILKNQWGELQETVGSKLVPILQKLAEKVLEIIKGFQDGTGTGGKLREAFEKIKKTIEDNRPELEKLGKAIAVIAEVIVTKVLPVAVKFQTEVVSKIIDGVGLIVGAFQGLQDIGVSVARAIIPPFLDVFDTLINGAAKAFGWVPGIGDKLETAAREFSEFKDKANAALDGIQDKDVTIRLRKFGTGAQELNMISDEKELRRNGPAPAKTYNRGGQTAGNLTLQNNLDGRKVTSAVSSIRQGDLSRGYLPAY